MITSFGWETSVRGCLGERATVREFEIR